MVNANTAGVVELEQDGSMTVETTQGRAYLACVTQGATWKASSRGIFIGLVRHWPRTNEWEAWYPIGSSARGAVPIARQADLREVVGKLLTWAVDPRSGLVELQASMFDQAAT